MLCSSVVRSSCFLYIVDCKLLIVNYMLCSSVVRSSCELLIVNCELLGAVHILRQPKTGVRRPPPPLCQQMSAFG